jgi:hypothetical protein
MTYGPGSGEVYPRPLDPPDGEEPDCSASYERACREALAQPNPEPSP